MAQSRRLYLPALRNAMILMLGCFALAGLWMFGGIARSASPEKPSLPKAERKVFAERFERDVWPLMVDPSEPEKGCLGCHGDNGYNTSDLVLTGDPIADFAELLDDGYFDRGNPASILARVSLKTPKHRMPPEPLKTWSSREVGILQEFVTALEQKRTKREEKPSQGQGAGLEGSDAPATHPGSKN